MNELKIKLNCDLNGFKAGNVIFINVDEHNVPLDIFWRRRLKDSAIDNCIEVVKDKKASSNPSHNKNKKIGDKHEHNSTKGDG